MILFLKTAYLDLKHLHNMATMKKALFLGLRSSPCDVRLVERLGPLPLVEDNNSGGQQYPLEERTEFNPGSINLVITICYYDEEYDDEKKNTPNPFLNAVCPQGIQRNNFFFPAQEAYKSVKFHVGLGTIPRKAGDWG